MTIAADFIADLIDRPRRVWCVTVTPIQWEREQRRLNRRGAAWLAVRLESGAGFCVWSDVEPQRDLTAEQVSAIDTVPEVVGSIAGALAEDAEQAGRLTASTVRQMDGAEGEGERGACDQGRPTLRLIADEE